MSRSPFYTMTDTVRVHVVNRTKTLCHDIEFLMMWTVSLLMPDASGHKLTAHITITCAQ